LPIGSTLRGQAGTRADATTLSAMALPETNSVAIASNESFSGWTKTFTDPRLCAAIVDRLTFAGNIIETGTVSYRLAHARAQRASR
jgi:IstB-like ATP binding protein